MSDARQKQPAFIAGLRDRQLVRFLLVGLINTAIGYGIFLALHLLFSVPPWLANAIGYAVAIAVAFSLYGRYVFTGPEGSASAGRPGRYIGSVLMSLGLNQAVLALLLWTDLPPWIAQIGAMASYTLCLFTLNKVWVFR